MIGGQQLSAMRKEAAARARRAKALPKVCRTEQDLKGVPNFGDYRPKGWHLTAAALVDHTFGTGDAGMSWGVDRLLQKCKARPNEGLALIEEGQFQVVIGFFAKGEAPEDHEPERLIGISPWAELK